MQKQKHGALRPAIAALFCTLVFALTWIYVPAGLGNVNLGDAAVLLTAWVLGGVWGMLAAGVGAALVDLLAGYTVYAPGTLVIKALMVLVALGVYRLCRRMPARLGYVLSGVAAEAVGNIGLPFCELGDGIAVAELSSFMLHYMTPSLSAALITSDMMFTMPLKCRKSSLPI